MRAAVVRVVVVAGAVRVLGEAGPGMGSPAFLFGAHVPLGL